MPLEATDPCKVGVVGSTPIRSTMARRRKTAGKRRRSVRCTMCTTHRWLGNAKGRFKAKDEREMRDRQRLDCERDN